MAECGGARHPRTATMADICAWRSERWSPPPDAVSAVLLRLLPDVVVTIPTGLKLAADPWAGRPALPSEPRVASAPGRCRPSPHAALPALSGILFPARVHGRRDRHQLLLLRSAASRLARRVGGSRRGMTRCASPLEQGGDGNRDTSDRLFQHWRGGDTAGEN